MPSGQRRMGTSMCSLVIQKYIFLTFDGQPVASPVFSNFLVTMTERKRKRTPLRKIKMFFPAYAEGKTQIADARAEGFKVMDRIRINVSSIAPSDICLIGLRLSPGLQ